MRSTDFVKMSQNHSADPVEDNSVQKEQVSEYSRDVTESKDEQKSDVESESMENEQVNISNDISKDVLEGKEIISDKTEAGESEFVQNKQVDAPNADSKEVKATKETIPNKSKSKKEKKASLPVRSLTDAEYKDIFDAVLKRAAAELEDEAAAAAAEEQRIKDEKAKESKADAAESESHQQSMTGKPDTALALEKNVTEDDFDAILQENDENIGKYVEAFLSEEEDKMEEDETITSTPVLEQAVHCSQERKEKSEKKVFKTLPKKAPRSEVCVGHHRSTAKSQKKTTLAEKKQKIAHREKSPQVKENISKKQIMLKRKVETKGTWVQCEDCNKWRYLRDVSDPALLPAKWTCESNTDTDRNSCDHAEDSWDVDEHTDEFVFTKFTEGSLVWARMDGFPWWPALVEIDPDEQVYCYCNVQMKKKVHGLTNVATHYHVVFFDEKVSRAWVRSANVHVFTGMEDMGSCKVRGVSYKKQIQKAMDEALDCLALGIPDRIQKYGFAARYEGKWDNLRKGAKDKKRRKRKRQTKLSDDNVMDTSILENAEILLKNTETALDELLSQSDSEEEALQTALPLKKRKLQAKETDCKSKEKSHPKATNEKLVKPKEVASAENVNKEEMSVSKTKSVDSVSTVADKPKSSSKVFNAKACNENEKTAPTVTKSQNLHKSTMNTSTPKKESASKKKVKSATDTPVNKEAKSMDTPTKKLASKKRVKSATDTPLKKDSLTTDTPTKESGSKKKVKPGTDTPVKKDTGNIKAVKKPVFGKKDANNKNEISQTNASVEKDSEETSEKENSATCNKKNSLDDKAKVAKPKKGFVAPVVKAKAKAEAKKESHDAKQSPSKCDEKIDGEMDYQKQKEAKEIDCEKMKEVKQFNANECGELSDKGYEDSHANDRETKDVDNISEETKTIEFEIASDMKKQAVVPESRDTEEANTVSAAAADDSDFDFEE